MVFGKERNESIDLLRLIAMIFIVCIHYVGWGGALQMQVVLHFLI